MFIKSRPPLSYPLTLLPFLALLLLLNACKAGGNTEYPTGNVVFIHPDGTAGNTWGALRIFKVGPDGNLNWDKLDHMGLYRSHQLDVVGTSSNAGATAHAYGVKAEYDDYGIDPDRPFNALSGKPMSIMMEAQAAGYSVAVINSGNYVEPGTGVFLASSKARNLNDEITAKILMSNADVIFGPGEALLLPEGVTGVWGVGQRKDGKNLIKEAQQQGYTVIYTQAQLAALAPTTSKVLGVFALHNTYNDVSEEELSKLGKTPYLENTPSVAEMTDAAIKLFSHREKPFFIVVEEEGTDNFGNAMNASGVFEALNRADEAIGVVTSFIETNPNTLLVVAADSDAGGMQVIFVWEKDARKPLAPLTWGGAPQDGITGTGTLPFISQPDQFGRTHAFAISWVSRGDVYGGVIARAHGLNAELLPNNVDNTDIYRLMYTTLFGIKLD